MPEPRQSPSWSPNSALLLAAGQKGLEVVTVGAGFGRTRKKKRCPGAGARLPRCPSLRVCRHTRVVAVLFYVTNCVGPTEWQAAESAAPAGGLAGRSGWLGASFQTRKATGCTQGGVFPPEQGTLTGYREVSSGSKGRPEQLVLLEARFNPLRSKRIHPPASAFPLQPVVDFPAKSTPRFPGSVREVKTP